MDRPEYDTDGLQVITVGFAPLSVAMTIHYAYLDDETGETMVVETEPVIGWLTRHYVNQDRDVVFSDVVPARWDRNDTRTAEAAEESWIACRGVEFVGIYLAGEKPDARALEHAETMLRIEAAHVARERAEREAEKAGNA